MQPFRSISSAFLIFLSFPELPFIDPHLLTKEGQHLLQICFELSPNAHYYYFHGMFSRLISSRGSIIFVIIIWFLVKDAQYQLEKDKEKIFIEKTSVKQALAGPPREDPVGCTLVFVFRTTRT